MPDIKCCTFDAATLKAVGVASGKARQCPNCGRVFVPVERQEGEMSILRIHVYNNILEAAGEQTQEFQTSLF